MRQQITVIGNKLDRITVNEVKKGSLCVITHNEETFFSGDFHLPVIWNNIIGANFNCQPEHYTYLTETIKALPGSYAFIANGSVIDNCTINF